MAAGEATGLRQEVPAPASLRAPTAGAVAVLLAAGALYLDAVTPLGYGEGILFLVPFLVVVYGLPRVPPLAAAAAAILLSATGLLLSTPGIPVAVAYPGPAGAWIFTAGIPAAVALVGRAASWLLIAGIAVIIEGRRSRGREEALVGRYRVLFREHDAAVLVIDPTDGAIVDANPAAARFFWSSPADLRGLRIADLNGSPGGSAGPRLEGQRTPLRFVYRHASGERRYVEICSVPVTVEGRTLLYSAVYDVTDAHRVGETLRESERRHRSLVDALPEGMVLYGAIPGPDGEAEDFRVLDLNAAGERVFGRTRERTIGKTLRELAEEPPPWFDSLVRVAESGRPELCSVAGRIGDRRFAVRLYRPAPGQVAGLYLEMTERLRADGAEASEASNADLERFAQVAGSDLLEPLWTIISFAELLRHRSDERLDRDNGEIVDYILASARRMERLIDGLLRDVRVNTRRLVFEPVDLGTALAAVEASLAGEFREAGATVTHDSLPVVLADRSMLEQVFEALIGNTLGVCGAGCPRIHLSAVREGNLWRIRIAGSGAGAPSGAPDEAFDPFRRPHLRAERDGYAIGLPTVKRIVERLGGSIRVEAGGRTGSSVSFTVPAMDTSPVRSET